MKACKPEYLAKALLLSKDEQERLLSRMSGKLPNRLDKNKISIDEALALQLETEDEQLQEWRQKMHDMKAKETVKGAKKSKAKAVSEPVAKPKKKAKVEKVKQPATPAAKKTASPAPARTAKPAAPVKKTTEKTTAPATVKTVKKTPAAR